MNLFIRTFRYSLATLLIGVATLSSCSDEPLPRARQVADETALNPLIGRRGNPFNGEAAVGSDSGTWQGGWILGGHILTLTATHLPPGRTENKVYLFGYSVHAKRYFMMVVTAGKTAPDSVSVSWFTIKDKVWRFMPEEETVGGKAVERQMVWDTREQTAKLAASVAASDTGWTLPPPRKEMSRFTRWQGHWPDRRTETTAKGGTALIDGTFDSKKIANGYFLVWLTHNDVTLPNAGRSVDREVDVWGFADVPQKYFRVDVVTGFAVAPFVAYAPWFDPFYDEGLILSPPYYNSMVGNESLPTRYGLVLDPPDTLFVFEQYRVGGINWKSSAARQAKWVKIQTAPEPTK